MDTNIDGRLVDPEEIEAMGVDVFLKQIDLQIAEEWQCQWEREPHSRGLFAAYLDVRDRVTSRRERLTVPD